VTRHEAAFYMVTWYDHEKKKVAGFPSADHHGKCLSDGLLFQHQIAPPCQ
jgi:hypothetical protein